ncbi:MAG: hydrogenase maturation protease [Planctomycetes bacterium]|nr:hydrogenase maturation protease [Planctomycetota bacterium]
MTARVIGLGNRLRGDDGLGLEVAERLRGTAGVEVLARESAPPDLFLAWGPEDDVVLVDAARSGSPPGTVLRFDAVAAALPCDLLRVSTHGDGAPAAVELARALERLPRRLVVLAVEGASFDLGAGLSAQVAQAVDAVARRALEELGRA